MGTETNDVVQLLKETAKHFDWVLPCVPHAEEAINEEVDVTNTRLKRLNNLITLENPTTQNDLEQDGYHANKQAIKEMANAITKVMAIKKDQEEDTRTPPTDPNGKVNMSNLSIETVKAASLLGHDRSKIV